MLGYLEGISFIFDLDRHGGDLRAMIWDTSTMSTLHPFEGMLHSWNPSTNLVMLVAHRVLGYSPNLCVYRIDTGCRTWFEPSGNPMREIMISKFIRDSYCELFYV